MLDLFGVVQPAASLNHSRDSDDAFVISYPGEDVPVTPSATHMNAEGFYPVR